MFDGAYATLSTHLGVDVFSVTKPKRRAGLILRVWGVKSVLS